MNKRYYSPGQIVAALKEYFPLGFGNHFGEHWCKARVIGCEGWPFYEVEFADGKRDVLDVIRIR